MEFLIGLLTGVAFFIVFASGLYFGKRMNKHQIYKPPEVTEQQKREAEQLNADFKKLFSYDVNQAISRKQVD